MSDVNLAHAVFDRVGQLNSLLAENLAAFNDPDVYVRAAAREHAALLYRQLGLTIDNEVVRNTFVLAADACVAEAAALRTRHPHAVPSPGASEDRLPALRELRTALVARRHHDTGRPVRALPAVAAGPDARRRRTGAQPADWG